MKSAYELAMSRLEKNVPTRSLSEEQKMALAEIDSEFDARIAERRIFLEGELAKAAGDEATSQDLRRQLAGEVATLQEKRELRKEQLRNRGEE
jgi:hypothetical protein